MKLMNWIRVGLVSVAAMAGLGGCAAYKPLSVEPLAATKVAKITPRFEQTYYRMDRDKNLHFILSSRGADKATGQTVEQITIIRMFWQPKGGQTTMNASALNASFRYIVMTPTSVGMYEGAGFVRIYRKPNSTYMSARIVDGDIHLTEASENFNDNLGRARFRGNFTAELSDAKTMDMFLEARRNFFTRSLDLAGTPGAGTGALHEKP